MNLSCMVLFSDCENPNRKLFEWNTNQLFFKRKWEENLYVLLWSDLKDVLSRKKV